MGEDSDYGDGLTAVSVNHKALLHSGIVLVLSIILVVPQAATLLSQFSYWITWLRW